MTFSPISPDSASGRVRPATLLPFMISGRKKLFHWARNTNTARAARLDLTVGRATRQYTCHSPAPSSRAASESSGG